ncbi:lipopolysaccharide assembly protein LapA domain-containing protein [Aliidiomarina sp. Khilg15.8]
MWRVLFVLLPLAVLFIIALVFGTYNKTTIPVHFIVAQKEMTVAALLALFLGIGFLFGAFSMSLSYWRLRMKNRRLRKELSKVKH